MYSFFELISNQPANSDFTIMMIGLVLVSIIYFIWKRNKSIQYQNVLIAYFAILVFQIFLFVMGSLSETGSLDLSISFPIIDRLQFTFTTVLLIWMLNPFKKNLNSPSMSLSIIFLIMGFALVSGVFWKISNTTRFNYTWIDISWELINILVVLISMVCLIRNQSKSWKFGYFLFMILFLGLSIHFLVISQNEYYSGSIRFSQLVVLVSLPTSFKKYFDTSELTIEPTIQQEVTNELRLKPSPQKEDSNPKILPEENIAQKYNSEFPKILLWLELAAQGNEEELIPKLTKALATSIFQGIVLQAKVQALSNQIIITSGYDYLNKKLILPINLTIKDNSPLIDLIGKTDPSFIAFDIGQSYEDVNALKSFLNLVEFNNIIFFPLQNEINNVGSLLIIFPLNENIWQFEDHHNFENLSD